MTNQVLLGGKKCCFTVFVGSSLSCLGLFFFSFCDFAVILELFEGGGWEERLTGERGGGLFNDKVVSGFSIID